MMKMTKKASIFVLGLVAFVMLITSFFFATTVSATVSDELISIMPGADVRIDTDNDAEDKTGIRFTINVNKEKYEALTAEGEQYAGYTASIGAAVIPTKYLGINEFDAKNTVYNYNGKDQAVLHIPLVNKIEEVVNEGTENEFTQQTYKAVVKDIPANNYETELSVKGYIKLTAEGEDDVYIQTDVVSRSIGKVITTFYTATDPELAPNEFQKPVLEKMIENGVKPSLAAKLGDGYLADFSSSSYNALVEEMKPSEYNSSIAWDIVDFDGLTNVLKVDMVTASNSNAGFILNLPKQAGQNKLQVKLYVACDVGMGFEFLSPSDGSTVITDNIASLVNKKWHIQTLDYSNYENTSKVYVHPYTGSGNKQITVYIAFVRLEKQMNPTGNMLADYSNYAYESTLQKVQIPQGGYPNVSAKYLEEFNGEQNVLKIYGGTSSGYFSFKLNLPKAATGKVVFKMYIEYDGSMGMLIGDPDTAITGGSSTYGQEVTPVKNAWAIYEFDYTEYNTKDVLEISTWASGTPTVYISYVKNAELADGYLADFSNELYESSVKAAETPWGTPTVNAEYMEEFNGEQNVLKMYGERSGDYFSFRINLPKKATGKVVFKMYIEYDGSMGMLIGDPDTAITGGSSTYGQEVTPVKNAWATYEFDYTEYNTKDVLEISTWAGRVPTIYISYVMIAE